MEFLATHWGYFLAGTILFVILAAVNQISRMQRMMGTMKKTFESGEVSFSSASNSFFKGVFLLVFFSIASGVCGVLFIIGVIAALLHH